MILSNHFLDLLLILMDQSCFNSWETLFICWTYHILHRTGIITATLHEGIFLINSGYVIIDINTLHRLFVRCYLWIINSTWFVFKQTLMSRYHSEILLLIDNFIRYLWLSVTDHRWNNTASVRAGVCVYEAVLGITLPLTENTNRKTQLIDTMGTDITHWQATMWI